MLFVLRLRRFVTALVCLFFLSAAQIAHASFSLTFQGLVRDINSGGAVSFHNPSAVVVDAAGNTYISDTSNNRIIEFDAHGIASVLTISGLSPGIAAPSALALDSSGNLYIADAGNSRVVMVSPSRVGSIVSTGSVAITSPRGVVVDQSGNLFITDTGNSRIVEVTAGGIASALTITVSSGSSTFSSPMGLAVNAVGKLYIADAGNNRIVTVAPGSTTGVVAPIIGGVSLSGPKSVAVDRIGNIIIADSFNSRVAEIDTSGNGTVLYTGINSLNGPTGVAVDPFGTIYIADTSDNRVLVVDPPVNGDLTSEDATYSLNQSVIGFGHIQLGSFSAVTLTMQFTSGQVGLGAVKILTAGTENLDFTSGPDTTCNGSTGASTSCFIQVSFLPTAPGLRKGAIALYDTSMNPILTIPIYGYGDAPVVALSPNVGSVLSTGSFATANPYQIALDGAGNFYIGDYTGKNVTKVPAGGGTPTVLALGSPGDPSVAPQNIAGVAVDGAGNLFIADHQNSRILVMTPGGVVSVLSITGLSTPLGLPTALSFDSAGNLYIGDYGNGRVIEVSSLVVAGSNSSGLGTAISTGSYIFNADTLTGQTVDQQGTIYIAAGTQNSSGIIKVTNAGAVSKVTIPGNITPAISNPQGVAVDGMGNLYIVDTSNSRIVEITTSGVATALKISGLTSPTTLSGTNFGVTVDSFGNLYIADWTNNRIVYVNVTNSALSFASTNVGSTSSDSPKTATVTNLGNLPLVFSTNPSFTADFIENGSDSNPCTSETVLSVGTLCDVSVKFTPQSAGSLSAGITVTNNALNIASSTQQITVSGTGINPGDTTATTVSIAPSPAVYGQAVTIVARVTDTQSGHTVTIPAGSVSFTDMVQTTAQQLSSANIDANGNATLTGVVLNGLGTHTITASYAGVTNTFLVSNNTSSIVIGQATVTVAGPSVQPVSVVSGQAGSIAVTVTGAYAASNAPSGVISYSILNASNVSVLSGTAQLAGESGSSAAAVAIPNTLAAGTYTVSITYGGDPNYQSSPTAIAVSLHVGQITPTIAWNASRSISYGTNLNGLLTATATNGDTSIPGVFTYTATRSGGVASPITATTVLGAGAYVLTAIFTPTDTTTYTTNTGTATLTVGQASTTPSLISSINPSIFMGSVTFTAAATSSVGTPTGTMNFYDGTTLLGTAVLSQGQASYTTGSLAVGSHSVTAVYSGDSNFTTSTSSAVVQLVQDFSFSAGSSGSTGTPTATVAPGGTATYTLSFGPTAGTVFPAPVTLSLAGLPPGATGTLSPQTLPAGSGVSTVTLTIQLPQPTAELHRDLGLAAPALALFLLPFAGKMRRSGKALQRLSFMLLLLIAGAGAMAGLTGCGAKDSGFFGQAQKTYNVQIIATSGSLSHSTSVTLTVQ